MLKFHSPISPDPLDARRLRSLRFPKSPPLKNPRSATGITGPKGHRSESVGILWGLQGARLSHVLVGIPVHTHTDPNIVTVHPLDGGYHDFLQFEFFSFFF